MPAIGSPLLIEESVSIDRPAPEVWDAIADYSLDERWRGGLTDMTPDPPGGPAPGTRVHEVVRFSGRSYVTDSVVTAVDPGVSYEFEGSGTSGEIHGGRTVRPGADGQSASFTYRIELRPKKGLRPLAPLLRPVLRSGLRKDLARLKALLESR